ncbi:hypothetical protein K458DRAFT_399451 [Lentithecium fluviatile CBS 122367]|uniref:Amidase domain-containing protein n=1 Tax=Lentithecium fluviatile CBS 122367 TaxID=1168545 RepID=A0A6G1JIJ1_9PLEO|nr:hypothetical protein K458DRAFT_399451 [Lentithecium fluviatile CBS 122367]
MVSKVMIKCGCKAQMLCQEFSLGEDHFLAMWPQHFAVSGLSAPSLLTVITYNNPGPVSFKWITQTIHDFFENDVFRSEFFRAVLFTHSATQLDVTSKTELYLRLIGYRFIATQRTEKSEAQIASGPYFYADKNLHPAWKLYEDTHGAFLHTLIVNVNGWRVAVKDSFEIENIRTSACNQAFYEPYPPRTKTAACIQDIYDAGAVVVDTTKLASFAATEEPMKCINWQAPWNPRADGYQSPTGCSQWKWSAPRSLEWVLRNATFSWALVPRRPFG